MKPFKHPPRHLLPWLAVWALAAAGCATRPQPAVQADGTTCYRYKGGTPPYDKPRYRACTTQPVPPAEADREAKRFEPAAGLAAVYVVRQGWGGGSDVVAVEVDGRARAETIPRSMVRVQLPPGEHLLAFDWQGRRFTQPLLLKAGDVQFVGLEASGWLPAQPYAWARLDDAGGQALARQARLVADLRWPLSPGRGP